MLLLRSRLDAGLPGLLDELVGPLLADAHLFAESSGGAAEFDKAEYGEFEACSNKSFADFAGGVNEVLSDAAIAQAECRAYDQLICAFERGQCLLRIAQLSAVVRVRHGAQGT